MKVLFIVPYPSEGPSNRFRIEQYLPFLGKRGITYCLRPFYDSLIYKILHKKGYYLRKVSFLLLFTLRRMRDAFSARFYDVTVIHREAFPFAGYLFEKLFRIFAKRLIYDFDDSVFLKKPSKIKTIVSTSDCVIAGNEFLKRYATQYNRKAVILPTCIDTDKYRPKAESVDKKNIVIGWIGTSFTAIYLDLLVDVFRELARVYRKMQVRIVGGHLDNSDFPLICKDWALESEINDLQEFDIGVMPLFDDDWAKGKCAFKLIQYMAMGIPAVASRVGMNTEVIEDGKNGFLVNSKEEWFEKLSLLIENPELRKNIGFEGRRTVEQKYSVQTYAEKYIEVLEDICGKDNES